MRTTFTLLGSAVAAFIAVLGFVAAWKGFAFTHFFVTDAVGDAREMQGDGPQPEYWRDFVGYLWFYLPALLITGLAGSFAAISGFLLKRSLTSPERSTNRAEPIAAGQPATRLESK